MTAQARRTTPPFLHGFVLCEFSGIHRARKEEMTEFASYNLHRYQTPLNGHRIPIQQERSLSFTSLTPERVSLVKNMF